MSSNPMGRTPANLLLALYLLIACAGWTLWIGDPCFLADVRDTDALHGAACDASYAPLSLVVKSVALVVFTSLATWLALRGLAALSMTLVIATASLSMTVIELGRLALRGRLQYLYGSEAREFLAHAASEWFLSMVLAAMGAALGAWLIQRRTPR